MVFGGDPLAGGRAPYACRPEQSKGRLYQQAESPGRSAFQRDRDRVIHSTAFRRLKHKTQVFVYHEGDHFRTRLTHTIEVAQIARAMARMLGADEDLTEALALAHDLGHPPFGHAGETALDEAMRAYGGFDHNAQTLRIVTKLEHRYAEFDGLNLTWECLEGLVKHNGPLTDRAGTPVGRYAERGIPRAIVAYQGIEDLQLWSFAGLEAQIAAMADDVAYDNHDLDDGLRAGLLDLDALRDVPLVGDCLREVDARYPRLEQSRRLYETQRRLITLMVNDLVGEARRRLEEDKPGSADDVRRGQRQIVDFSTQIRSNERDLKAYLTANVYRHERVMAVMNKAAQVVRDLFTRYMTAPDTLPAEWRAQVGHADDLSRARRICDFVAGMTDRFALSEHERLFDATPELR